MLDLLQPTLPWSQPLPRIDQTLPGGKGDSLAVTDAYSAMRATGFRISIDWIKDQIATCHFANVGDAMETIGLDGTAAEHRTTLCSITTKSGFLVLGKSTPLDPINYDVEKGKTFAYEDAIRQLWPLFAFAYAMAHVPPVDPAQDQRWPT